MPPIEVVDNEDVLPAQDRASNYVNKLLTWRPQCLFGILPDSDSEDDEVYQRCVSEGSDEVLLPSDLENGSYAPCIEAESVDLGGLELPALEDFQLPDPRYLDKLLE